MTATEQNFTMNAGETKRIDVASTTDEDSGGDLDITGFTEVTWTLERYKGGEVVLTKKESDSGNDVNVTDAATGAYEVTINPSDTEDLVAREPEEFYHRVRLEDGSGRKSDLLEGTITIEP